MESTTELNAPQQRTTRVAVTFAIGTAVVLGLFASVVIAAVAHGAGVSREFLPLHFATFTVFIVLAAVVGAIGWQLVRQRAASPSRVLTRLVPVVLLLSFIPDVAIGITKAETATTWGGVVALMAMHVVVATAAVASYLHFLPVRLVKAGLGRTE